MKFIHFYASEEPKEFDAEQPNPLELATSQLTKQMVLRIISHHARGRTPYHLEVPPSMLFEAHEWRIPTTLLLIDPIYESPNDISPIARATLGIQSGAVFIHARRRVDPSTK